MQLFGQLRGLPGEASGRRRFVFGPCVGQFDLLHRSFEIPQNGGMRRSRRFVPIPGLVLALLLAVAPVRARARPIGSDIPVEARKGLACHLVLDRVRAGNFEQGRTFSDYARWFGASLADALRALGKDGVWIDMGSGYGRAVRDALKEGRFEGQAVTVTAGTLDGATREANALFGARLRSFEGKFLEDMPPGMLPKAGLITDYYGPFSYAPDIGGIVRRYLELLPEGGEAMILSEGFALEGVNGTFRAMLEWLGEGHGFSTRISGDVLVLRREARPIQLPKLELVSIVDGAPPERLYRRAR